MVAQLHAHINGPIRLLCALMAPQHQAQPYLQPSTLEQRLTACQPASLKLTAAITYMVHTPMPDER